MFETIRYIEMLRRGGWPPERRLVAAMVKRGEESFSLALVPNTRPVWRGDARDSALRRRQPVMRSVPRMMDRLAIDGMNLIGSWPDGWWNDPDRAMRRLIEDLDGYATITGHDVTVVFDRPPSDVSPGTHGAVTVVFASLRGRDAADHEIVRIVTEDPSPRSINVVTSDRRLIESVRQVGARVTSSMSFRHRLASALGSGRAT